MAWLVRSQRDSIIPPTATPETVGPGAYDTGHSSIKSPRASYAPFQSTTPRSWDYANENAAAVPGPGSYTKPPERVVKEDAKQSMLASQVARFQSTPNSENPGPGAYYSPTDWSKTAKRLTLTTIRRNLDHHPQERGKLEWVKLGSVPSIPTNDQSYGFVETQAGALKPQPPPKRLPSEATRPLFSSFSKKPALAHHRSASAPSFGKAAGHCLEASLTRTSGLDGVGPNKTSAEPGPGQYEVSASLGSFGPSSGGVDAKFAHAAYLQKKPLSVFSSNVKRTFAPPPEPTPGPGTYSPPSSFSSASKKVPLVQQCFGSRADRNLKTFGSDLNTTPGPGAYSITNVVAAFPGGYGTDLASLLPSHAVQDKPTSVFRSTSPRFNNFLKVNSAAPGPGQYGVPGPGIIESLVQKQRNAGRNRSFGQTSARFPTKQEAAAPGPGTYEVAQDTIKPPSPRPTISRVHTEFVPPGVQAARARNAAQKTAMPAPGSYNLDVDGERRRKLIEESVQGQPKHFNSTTHRFDDVATIRNLVLNSHLGPGRYNPTDKPMLQKTQPVTSVFKSTQPRFADPTLDGLGPISSRVVKSTPVGQSITAYAEASSTPGPGEYVAKSDFIKHSYNVTIEAATAASLRRAERSRSKSRSRSQGR